MRKIPFFAILITTMLLHSHGLSGAAETWIPVRWVIDGDTIVIEGGKRVRYNGINAPEIADANRGKIAEPFGDAAKIFNKQLVKDKKVRLTFEVERQDRYQRLLAYVFLPDGTFVNAELVASGLAYFLAGTVNKKYSSVLLKTQREAMTAGKGMWPELIRQGQSYIGNRRSKRFHQQKCPFAKKIAIRNRMHFAGSREAFWAGYAPAKRCIQISELFRGGN